MLRVKLLGTGAGGGLPQWNCSCINCINARLGVIPSRTQCTLAVTENDLDWTLINCSPDIRSQISMNRELYPVGPNIRSSPIKNIILTGADLDQILGLLSLREFTNYTLYATSAVISIVKQSHLFGSLLKYINLVTVDFGTKIWLSSQISFCLIPVEGVTPSYLRFNDSSIQNKQFTSAVSFTDGHKSFLFSPTIKKLYIQDINFFANHDLILLDGTFYEHDELLLAVGEAKNAFDIGHIPMVESYPLLSCITNRLRYIHINNTNPINDPVFLRCNSLVPADNIASDGDDFCL
jgi:pyrroloquinoline quinone biosynthesis protein B